MNKVSNEIMNGCIHFVDNSDLKQHYTFIEIFNQDECSANNILEVWGFLLAVSLAIKYQTMVTDPNHVSLKVKDRRSIYCKFKYCEIFKAAFKLLSCFKLAGP